jgi:hypothetical protein
MTPAAANDRKPAIFLGQLIPLASSGPGRGAASAASKSQINYGGICRN